MNFVSPAFVLEILMKHLISLLVLVFVFAGCATLNEDPSMPAIEAGYPSAEGIALGEPFNGLKVVKIKKGEPLSKLGLKIQTYYSGSVVIDSKFCNISTGFEYKNSQIIDVPVSGEATQSCVITFTVTPTYPAQDRSAVKVHGFRGHIRVEVVEEGIDLEKDIVAFDKKGASNFSVPLRLDVGGTQPVKLFLQGCGADYSGTHELIGGILSIDVSPMLKIQDKETCVLEGLVVSPEFTDLHIVGLISKYDTKFSPLTIPNFEIDDGELIVEASSVVSVMGINQNFVFDTSISSDIDSGKSYTVRALTVKGRSVIGRFKNGVFQWHR